MEGPRNGTLVAGVIAVPTNQRFLYAGDLDLEVSGRLVEAGRALRELPGWSLEIACRPKHAEDAEARSALRRQLADQLSSGDVVLRGEVEDIDRVFRGASVQLFVASHVDRKVDLPLVLLEGLARGVPVVLADFAPVNEILATAEAHGVSVGAAFDPNEAGALRAAMHAAARTDTLARWHEGARVLAEAAYSLPRMASAHEALYQELCSREPGSP